MTMETGRVDLQAVTVSQKSISNARAWCISVAQSDGPQEVVKVCCVVLKSLTAAPLGRPSSWLSCFHLVATTQTAQTAISRGTRTRSLWLLVNLCSDIGRGRRGGPNCWAARSARSPQPAQAGDAVPDRCHLQPGQGLTDARG